MNINHISVSRTQVWNECKKKYYFKYHLQVPVEGPEPEYFLYGKLIHRIIEEFTLAKGERDINDIRKDCLDGVIVLEEGKSVVPRKSLSGEYLNKIPTHLQAFMKFAKRVGFEGECEWEFKHDLDPPNERCLEGFIDRLICRNNKYIIVDYKTTKKGPWRKNKRDVVGDLQLQCYSMVVMEQLNVDPANIYAALFYLDGEEFIGANFSEKTLRSCKDKLLALYKEIENADPDKTLGRTGNHCYRCDYLPICPLFSLTRSK